MTETKNNLMNAALHYASHGFYVLPIKPNAKNPAIKFKDQPALTADQIKSWWTKNPQDNIALRTVDHFVIDVDSVQHTALRYQSRRHQFFKIAPKWRQLKLYLLQNSHGTRK